MVDLMATGAYDGVSASGDATSRLIAKGDVAPVNFDLTPNYADVFEGLKNQSYNSVDGVGYGVPHGRGPNVLVFRNDILPADTNSWAPIWDGSQQGQAVDLRQPDLHRRRGRLPQGDAAGPRGSRTRTSSTRTQFNAAVDLLKKQKADIGKYWDGVTYADQVTTFKSGETTVGTTWPYQVEPHGGGEAAGRR